ncbi:APC family permease [Sphingosinicella soli]|uniref:Amino acid transporter n=1 Tax=Sphingosinicella soli TaxID=333708 RepID=A0A7W7B1D6_9SPHN|nr:amino acid transporter [Sphingosinicella soli]
MNRDNERLSSPFAAPRTTLGPGDLLALVIGIVVGAGIFRTPSLVAGAAESASAMLAVWAAGGVLSIIGALCYAELASTYPNMGGDYHFLGRAFGRRLAFFYAWARLAVIQTGSIALLAYIVGDYLAGIASVGPASPTLYAALAVIAVTALNWAGVRFGAGAQRWLTGVEILGLVLVIAAGLSLSTAEAQPLSPPAGGGIGLMLVFVLLT